MRPPTVYRGSRAIQIMVLVGAVVITIAGVLYTLVDEFEMLERIGYGVPIAVCGGWATVLAVRWLIRNPPELVLDSVGITLPRIGTVHWHRVAVVRVGRVGPHEAVQMMLHCPGLVVVPPAP